MKFSVYTLLYSLMMALQYRSSGCEKRKKDYSTVGLVEDKLGNAVLVSCTSKNNFPQDVFIHVGCFFVPYREICWKFSHSPLSPPSASKQVVLYGMDDTYILRGSCIVLVLAIYY